MHILIIYMFLGVFLGLIASKTKKLQIRLFCLKVVFGMTFLLAAFRGQTVGIDTGPTREIFQNIVENGVTELPRNTEIEKGFIGLIWILSKLTKNPQILFVVMSAVIYYGFYVLVRDYSKNDMLSCLIFISSIFMGTMNISRQYMAMTFIILSIKYVLAKKPFWTLAFIISACFFHYSAVIFLPLCLLALPKFRFTRKMAILISEASFLEIPIYMLLISICVRIFPQYARFLKSAKYAGTSSVSVVSIVYLFAVLLLVIWSGSGITFKKNKIIIRRVFITDADGKHEIDINDTAHYLFLILFVQYLVIYLISAKFSIARRIASYFQISLIIVLPDMLEKVRKRKLGKITFLLELFFIFYYIAFGLSYFRLDPHAVRPYIFFWQ